MTRTVCALFVAALLSSVTTPSVALTSEEKARVRELVKVGGELAHSGRFVEARDRLMTALELAPVPAIALYAARAYESLHEPLKAADLYRQASEMPLDATLWDNDANKTEVQLRSREQARVALMSLLERSCTVKLQLVGHAGGDVKAVVDGVPLAGRSLTEEQPVNPGSHVVAILYGSKRLSQTVVLDNAEHKTVTFDLTPASDATPMLAPDKAVAPNKAAAASSETPAGAAKAQAAREPVNFRGKSTESTGEARSYITWGAYGVGAAGLGTGIIVGILALDKRAALIKDGCSSDGYCPRNDQLASSKLDSYNTLLTITTIGFIVGGVGALTGVTLTLTKPTVEHAHQLTLLLGPGSIAARGTF